MKKSGKILFSILIFGLFVIIPAAAQKTRSDFQKMYMDYLKKKKLECSIMDNGEVYFRTAEGSGYYIIVNENEPQNFYVYTFVNLAGHQLGTTIPAANYTNIQKSCTKVTITNDGEYALFMYEGILPKPKDFSLVFDKIIAAIDDTVWFFAICFD